MSLTGLPLYTTALARCLYVFSLSLSVCSVYLVCVCKSRIQGVKSWEFHQNIIYIFCFTLLLPHHHHWLSAVRGCLPSAIVLFWSPPHAFGTVCRRTSRLHPRCLFFAVVWRHISSDAAFCDSIFCFFVVPVKCLVIIGHVNRSFYLLAIGGLPPTFELLHFVPPKVKPQQNRKSYVLLLKTLQIVHAFACNIFSKMSNYMH